MVRMETTIVYNTVRVSAYVMISARIVFRFVVKRGIRPKINSKRVNIHAGKEVIVSIDDRTKVIVNIDDRMRVIVNIDDRTNVIFNIADRTEVIVNIDDRTEVFVSVVDRTKVIVSTVDYEGLKLLFSTRSHRETRCLRRSTRSYNI